VLSNQKGSYNIMEKISTTSHSSEEQETRTQSPLVSWLKRHQLLAFFVLAYAITWGGWWLLIAFKLISNSLVATVFYPGWGPAIAALVLTALVGGKRGLREFFSSFVRWRVGLQWYAVALFFMIAVLLTAFGSSHLLFGTFPGNPILSTFLSSWYAFIPLFFPMVLQHVVLSALPEEPGWRGYALPRLLSRYNPLVASLILGLIMGLWHLPNYTILYPVGLLNLLLFLLQTVALNILYTWIYVHTKRSLLISILFHAAQDTAGTIFLSGVALTGMNGNTVMILITVVLWIAVAVVLIIFGPHLRRGQQGERTA
jgi:membrane protease YdiL (CAAX protease family)